MARGIGDIEGWPAVAWVAGMGAAMLLSSGVLWLYSRSFRDTPAEPAGYRSAGRAADTRGSGLRGYALLLVAISIPSQLLYVGLYLELAAWLLGARELPRITGDLFFWVLLVNATCTGGSLYASWSESR